MKKTLATALTLLAFAGTAVAQEAYGHYDYGSETTATTATVDTQGAYESQTPVAIDRTITSSTTQATDGAHKDAGQQVRWNQYD